MLATHRIQKLLTYTHKKTNKNKQKKHKYAPAATTQTIKYKKSTQCLLKCG